MMREQFPVAEANDHLLFDLSCSRVIGPVITLAQEIDLFELFNQAPQTIAEAANSLKVTPLVSEAFIAVLAAFGLLERQAEQRFGLTEVARTYMLPTSPFFYTGFCPPQEWYLDLLRMKVLGGGQPPMPLAVGMKQHSVEVVRSFIDRMHMMTLPAAAVLAKQPIFRQISHLLDVGGGSGSLAGAIAAFNPDIQCTILDLKPVCEIASENIEKYGLQERVTTVAKDMFEQAWVENSENPDAILFGNIFHDWDLQSCHLLAQKAFESLKPGGSILLHEMPLHETKDGPLTVACLSAILLMYENGKQYTLSELEQILTGAGFTNFKSTPAQGYYHLITASKPS